MEVLAGSTHAAQDRRRFFQTQMIFWVLAATDGHAKNFSIAHLPGNQYESTPLYDVLSAHPVIGRGRNQFAAQRVRLAMAVRGKNVHYLIGEIQRRHWIAQGRRVGLAAAEVETAIDEIGARTPQVIDEVAALLPGDFPMDLAEAIFDGMRRLVRKLAS
jgi:serine/threonine-protein kinase HipA